MFRITEFTQDAGAVVLPHLIVTRDGLDFDLGEVADLRDAMTEIHELAGHLWDATRNFAAQEMPAITANIRARLAAEPRYENVGAAAEPGQVTFRYNGLASKVYYQRHNLVMTFTLAGVHYAEISLLEQRYAGTAIAEAVITALAAMPEYPEATEEEITPTKREQQAARAIIKLLRSGNELSDPHIANIFATAQYLGKPLRVTALVIELLRCWLPDVGTCLTRYPHATHNRNSPTGKLFKQWFVAYGQYVVAEPASLLPPALTSVFLTEAGNG